MDTDENDLMRQIQMIRESIRLDWKNLASKKLTFDQRKPIREDIQMCISALRELKVRLKGASKNSRSFVLVRVCCLTA